jgi:hypothetical protein
MAQEVQKLCPVVSRKTTKVLAGFGLTRVTDLFPGWFTCRPPLHRPLSYPKLKIVMERALDQPNLKVWQDIHELYDLSARGPCAQLKKFNNNCTCMSKFLTLEVFLQFQIYYY